MTTLSGIGVYLGVGGVVFMATSIAFGVAVSRRSVGIAPRCTARPADVIFNPKPKDPSQERGSATW